MSKCPPRDCLQQFLLGRLSGSAEDAVCVHIEECLACQNELSRLVEGISESERSALRNPALASNLEEEAFLDQLKKTPPPPEWATASWNSVPNFDPEHS